MLRDIDAIAFDVLDPALSNRAVSVLLSFGVGDPLDLLDTINHEAKVMNAPGILVAMDER